MPAGWRPGMALDGPAPAVIKAEAVTVKREAVAVKKECDEVSTDQEGEPPRKAKKPYFRPTRELREWTAGYAKGRRNQGWATFLFEGCLWEGSS